MAPTELNEECEQLEGHAMKTDEKSLESKGVSEGGQGFNLLHILLMLLMEEEWRDLLNNKATSSDIIKDDACYSD